MYYALEGSANGETLQSKASDDECRLWCGHHWSDPTCICNTQHLEGVTVTAPNNQSITYMPLNGLHMGGESPYSDGGMGGNYWTYGGSGGGRSNPTLTINYLHPIAKVSIILALVIPVGNVHLYQEFMNYLLFLIGNV